MPTARLDPTFPAQPGPCWLPSPAGAGGEQLCLQKKLLFELLRLHNYPQASSGISRKLGKSSGSRSDARKGQSLRQTPLVVAQGAGEALQGWQRLLNPWKSCRMGWRDDPSKVLLPRALVRRRTQKLWRCFTTQQLKSAQFPVSRVKLPSAGVFLSVERMRSLERLPGWGRSS